MNVFFSHQITKGFDIQWVKCIPAWGRIFESTAHFDCMGKHTGSKMERAKWYQATHCRTNIFIAGMHWSNTVTWQVTGLVCPLGDIDGWCKQGNITKREPSYQRSSTFWQILQGRSDIVVTSLLRSMICAELIGNMLNIVLLIPKTCLMIVLSRDNAVYRSNSFKFERRAPEEPKTAIVPTASRVPPVKRGTHAKKQVCLKTSNVCQRKRQFKEQNGKMQNYDLWLWPTKMEDLLNRALFNWYPLTLCLFSQEQFETKNNLSLPQDAETQGTPQVSTLTCHLYLWHISSSSPINIHILISKIPIKGVPIENLIFRLTLVRQLEVECDTGNWCWTSTTGSISDHIHNHLQHLDDLSNHHTLIILLAEKQLPWPCSFSVNILVRYFCFTINHSKFPSDPQDAESDGPGWGNVNQAYEGEELQEPCEVGTQSNRFPEQEE